MAYYVRIGVFSLTRSARQSYLYSQPDVSLRVSILPLGV
jgi:hypothetical protein